MQLFFFNDTATTEIYTLSLHDALPIFYVPKNAHDTTEIRFSANGTITPAQQQDSLENFINGHDRSEEHTSELQSQSNLVCRLLLENKNDLHVGSELIVEPADALIEVEP